MRRAISRSSFFSAKRGPRNLDRRSPPEGRPGGGGAFDRRGSDSPGKGRRDPRPREHTGCREGRRGIPCRSPVASRQASAAPGFRRDYSIGPTWYPPRALPDTVGGRRRWCKRAARPRPRPAELVRGLGRLDATLLIVGSVIGSGIFFAPSIIAGYLQSPGLLLGLWVLGGLLTLAGALSYADSRRRCPSRRAVRVPLRGVLAALRLPVRVDSSSPSTPASSPRWRWRSPRRSASSFRAWARSTRSSTLLGRTFTTAQLVALLVVAVLTWLNVTGLRRVRASRISSPWRSSPRWGPSWRWRS